MISWVQPQPTSEARHYSAAGFLYGGSERGRHFSDWLLSDYWLYRAASQWLALIGCSVTESFHLNSEREGKHCQRPQLLFIFSRCWETLGPQSQLLLPRGPMLGHGSLSLVNSTPDAVQWLAAAGAVSLGWRETLKGRVYPSKRLLMFVEFIRVGQKHVLVALVASQHNGVLYVFSPLGRFISYLLMPMF